MTESETRAAFPPPANGQPAPIPPHTIKNGLMERVGVPEIEAALTRYNGDHALAATYLSLPVGKLTYYVQHHKELSRWARRKRKNKPTPPPPLTGIAKPVMVVTQEEMPQAVIPPNTSDAQMADIVAREDEILIGQSREDEKIKRDIIKLGGTKEQADMALGFKDLKGRHLESTLGLTTVGVTINFQGMMDILRKLEARIQAGGFHKNEHGDPTEESMVYQAYATISQECRRTAELCWKGQLYKAKIESLKRSDAKAAKATARAGFKPKAASVVI